MVIKSTRQENSVYDEMKSRVFNLYMIERQGAYEIYTADDELNEALEISEDNYNANLFKLDVLMALAKMHESVKRRFVEQKIYIDQMDIPEKQKVEAILTSACILKNFGTSIMNRKASNETICLLARAMVNIEPSSYSYYENLILYHFEQIVKMLRNVNGLKVNHVKQNKQYVKTENN